MKQNLLLGMFLAGVALFCEAGDFTTVSGTTYKDYALIGLSNDLKGIKVLYDGGISIVKPQDFPKDMQEKVQTMLKNPDMQAAAKRNKAREDARAKKQKQNIANEKKRRQREKKFSADLAKQQAAEQKATAARVKNSKTPDMKFSGSANSSFSIGGDNK